MSGEVQYRPSYFPRRRSDVALRDPVEVIYSKIR
jgi:hypothetical protein